MRFKKVIKRFSIILLCLIMIPLLACGVFFLVVPISRPDDAVRSYVLRKMPIGTSWEEVVKISNKKGWKIEEINDKHGLIINDGAGYADFAYDKDVTDGAKGDPDIKIVGVKAMFIELGEFYSPFHTAVFAYLAFDENDNLIEVRIRRDIDAL